MSCFLVELWTSNILGSIDESVGDYITTDFSFKESIFMSLGHILVDIDLREGLHSNMAIFVGKSSFTQVLDYYSVPFLCN